MGAVVSLDSTWSSRERGERAIAETHEPERTPSLVLAVNPVHKNVRLDYRPHPCVERDNPQSHRPTKTMASTWALVLAEASILV